MSYCIVSSFPLFLNLFIALHQKRKNGVLKISVFSVQFSVAEIPNN